MSTATDTSPAVLPTLADRPTGFVVIYDGHCRFCLANMRCLRKIDQGKIGYVSLHDPVVLERWPDLTHDELMKQIYLIDQRGGRHAGAAAFRFLSRHLAALWLLAPLLHIPGSLHFWQYLYRQVAMIRYRFGRTSNCDGDACRVHFGPK